MGGFELPPRRPATGDTAHVDLRRAQGQRRRGQQLDALAEEHGAIATEQEIAQLSDHVAEERVVRDRRREHGGHDRADRGLEPQDGERPVHVFPAKAYGGEHRAPLADVGTALAFADVGPQHVACDLGQPLFHVRPDIHGSFERPTSRRHKG